MGLAQWPNCGLKITFIVRAADSCHQCIYDAARCAISLLTLTFNNLWCSHMTIKQLSLFFLIILHYRQLSWLRTTICIILRPWSCQMIINHEIKQTWCLFKISRLWIDLPVHNHSHYKSSYLNIQTNSLCQGFFPHCTCDCFLAFCNVQFCFIVLTLPIYCSLIFLAYFMPVCP